MTVRAAASGMARPSPSVSGRRSAAGSVCTTSTRAAPRWKKRRMAPRDCGTANAATIAAAARAATSGQRRRRGFSANTRVSGQTTSSARSSVSRFIRLPQPFERPGRARLDGAGRDVERRGRLLLRELEEIAAGKHLARLIRQVVERCEQLRTAVVVKYRVLGGGGRLPRDFGARGRYPQQQVLPAACGAAPVPRLVRDDLEKPRTERLVDPGAAECAPRLRQPVLERVLGVGDVAGDDVGHAERNLLVRAHELLVRARVAALGAGCELSLVGWTALHSATTPRLAQQFQRE